MNTKAIKGRVMKRKTFINSVLVAALAISMASPAVAQLKDYKMTTSTPNQVTTPDKVETTIGTLEFFDGVPIGDTKEKIFDYMDQARAVQVYVNMIPAVSCLLT